MEKESRTFKLDKGLHHKFKSVCAKQGRDMSEVLNALMIKYIKHYEQR